MVGYEEKLLERRTGTNSVSNSGQVRTYVDGSASVLEVRTPDRSGLLHDLAAVVTAKGATIHLAKIPYQGDVGHRHSVATDPDNRWAAVGSAG